MPYVFVPAWWWHRIQQMRREGQIKAGKQEDNRDAAKILELAQHLVEQYVKLPAPKKREVVNSLKPTVFFDKISP